MNKIQKDILTACSNDYEIMYFIFAEVNYGGQIFNKEAPITQIKVSILEILREIENLVKDGYLECRTVGDKKVIQVDSEKL